jgi:hypothetical protein
MALTTGVAAMLTGYNKITRAFSKSRFSAPSTGDEPPHWRQKFAKPARRRNCLALIWESPDLRVLALDFLAHLFYYIGRVNIFLTAVTHLLAHRPSEHSRSIAEHPVRTLNVSEGPASRSHRPRATFVSPLVPPSFFFRTNAHRINRIPQSFILHSPNSPITVYQLLSASPAHSYCSSLFLTNNSRSPAAHLADG